jgi:homoserine dehydrogenase
MIHSKIKVGLFGFGVVGQGFYSLVKSRASDRIEIVHIAVKNPDKERSLPLSEFTFNYHVLLNDTEVELVVEATDDVQAAYDIVKTSLLRGISVVSANKKLLASHLEEFIKISKDSGAQLIFEAAAAAAIPVIGLLDVYFSSEPVKNISGIVNGTTNYILSQMRDNHLTYDTALKNAQELGFAESNPSSDVDGFDAAYKIVLLTAHAFGQIIKPSDVIRYGIRFIKDTDIQNATENNKVIKLIASSTLTNNGIVATVLPTLINKEDKLAQISAEFNAISIEAEDSGSHFFIGKGAGSLPTGAALIKDVLRIKNGGYDYNKLKNNNKFEDEINLSLELIFTFDKSIEINGFEEIESYQLLDNKKQIKGWISYQELKEQLPFLEKNNAGIIATGNKSIRKGKLVRDLNLS